MHSVTIVDAYLKGGDKCNVWKKQNGACSFSKKRLHKAEDAPYICDHLFRSDRLLDSDISDSGGEIQYS